MAKTKAFQFPENLMRRLRMHDSCVEYTGSKNANGYGTLRKDGRTALAHRAMYELMIGPIPDGLTLDHLCRNRACCNPGHLEPTTRRENTMRSPIATAAVHARKTHCPKGHPYDDANTYNYRGWRRCRACRYEDNKQRSRKEHHAIS